MYTFFADYLDLDDPLERWDDARGEYVQFGRVMFHSDRGFLGLMREWVVEGRVERYEGAVEVAVEDGYAADGVTAVELARDHLRLTRDEEAAASVGDEAVLVEFDFDDAEFERLRRELRAMFAGLLDVNEV